MSELLDQWLSMAQRALRTVADVPSASRAYPAVPNAGQESQMSVEQRAESAALMRVNHVGEVCAQALYEAQALGTRDPQLRLAFLAAAEEERDHLAWTQQRIDELNGRISLLTPAWYLGAFAIGYAVSRLGDPISLGFMAQTEQQVEQHLESHLARLPKPDQASRQVVQQMKDDEAAHAHTARALGGVELPPLARTLMRMAAKVMTTTAHRV